MTRLSDNLGDWVPKPIQKKWWWALFCLRQKYSDSQIDSFLRSAQEDQTRIGRFGIPPFRPKPTPKSKQVPVEVWEYVGELLDAFLAAKSILRGGIEAYVGTKAMGDLLPHIKRGQKTLRAARKGHEVTHGTKEEKQARWDEMRRTFDALHAKHQLWTYEELKRQTAKRHKCSSKTVGRHCSNPNSRKLNT